jgi:DNA-binding transcriptional MerR regulator
MTNVFFALTEEFNAEGVIALLASGQAVVFYRIALMSKDGDWVLRESEAACRRVRSVLARRGARYRPGAPLDPRWLAGGWSSHFEFFDEQRRRIRCDFVSRPPRIAAGELDLMFSAARGEGGLRVVDPERLIRLKQTQRAKDYPVIAEISRLLPQQGELETTTDPDRILALAGAVGGGSPRESVRLARLGRSREQVVAALAREIDRLQQDDRLRLQGYEQAARAYLAAFRSAVPPEATLEDAHATAVGLAERLLPMTPESRGTP